VLRIERVTLDALLSTSDVVCLLASAATGTAPILDARAIARMRPDAFLVNTARGSLVTRTRWPRRCATAAGRRGAGRVPRRAPAGRQPAAEPPNAFLTPHMVAHAREVFDSLAPPRRQRVGDPGGRGAADAGQPRGAAALATAPGGM
jgi:phosphoglycerate dehydrogenase-like enzyme